MRAESGVKYSARGGSGRFIWGKAVCIASSAAARMNNLRTMTSKITFFRVKKYGEWVPFGFFDVLTMPFCEAVSRVWWRVFFGLWPPCYAALVPLVALKRA